MLTHEVSNTFRTLTLQQAASHHIQSGSEDLLDRSSLPDWWAHQGSNLGPLPCQGSALPLSYAPTRKWSTRKGGKDNGRAEVRQATYRLAIRIGTEIGPNSGQRVI